MSSSLSASGSREAQMSAAARRHSCTGPAGPAVLLLAVREEAGRQLRAQKDAFTRACTRASAFARCLMDCVRWAGMQA